MGGYMDIEFWVNFLIISIPAFCGGWIARSWLQMEKERASLERAKRLHPATQPRHMWIIEDEDG